MSLEIDPQSQTWKAIAAYAEAKLVKYRTDNDSTGLDEVQTAALRGRIASMKELLALAKAPVNLSDDDSFGY